jgi:hypothetical protein
MTAPDEFAADSAAAAIVALTAAARQTRVRGAGTDQAVTEPADFADVAAHVLTAVAANVGGVETLLAGRPGSWEADLVRQLVSGTAGEDGDLVRWRTEPVRLPLDVDDVFFDLGVGEVYEQDRDQAAEAACDEDLTDEQRGAAEDLVDAIEALWEADQVAYVGAYRATARRYLTEHGATCGVEIVAPPLPHPDPFGWDGLGERVDEYARTHTPLPMTGNAPDWRAAGLFGDALRRAGLTYTDRARRPVPPGGSVT